MYHRAMFYVLAIGGIVSAVAIAEAMTGPQSITRCITRDSTSVVHAAIRAIGGGKSAGQWRVARYSRTDSGTVVMIMPRRPSNPRMTVAGGGGIVLVARYDGACVLQLFR